MCSSSPRPARRGMFLSPPLPFPPLTNHVFLVPTPQILQPPFPLAPFSARKVAQSAELVLRSPRLNVVLYNILLPFSSSHHSTHSQVSFFFFFLNPMPFSCVNCMFLKPTSIISELTVVGHDFLVTKILF